MRSNRCAWIPTSYSMRMRPRARVCGSLPRPGPHGALRKAPGSMQSVSSRPPPPAGAGGARRQGRALTAATPGPAPVSDGDEQVAVSLARRGAGRGLLGGGEGGGAVVSLAAAEPNAAAGARLHDSAPARRGAPSRRRPGAGGGGAGLEQLDDGVVALLPRRGECRVPAPLSAPARRGHGPPAGARAREPCAAVCAPMPLVKACAGGRAGGRRRFTSRSGSAPRPRSRRTTSRWPL